MIERGDDDARIIGRLAYPLSGSGYTVGITGAPGAGKSTLTSSVIGELRAQGLDIAVLAIDPSSPFTGGAILGDRVRMQDHATDPGVFIRSMATRGHLGGLSLATPEAVRLLDAIGRRWTLVETVGVGQVEVEVAGKADTTVVVVNPGWGDSVQANKAGLMEIADVFVINKADRDGVEETARDLMQMLDLSSLPHDRWRPPIVATVGTTGDGVAELWEAVLAHRAHAEQTGELAERRAFRLGEELREIVAQRLGRRAREICSGDRWAELTAEVVGRLTDPEIGRRRDARRRRRLTRRAQSCGRSVSGEGGLAVSVLEEARHAGASVVGAEDFDERRAFDRQPVGQCTVEAIVDRLLADRLGGHGAGGDFSGEAERAIEQGVGLDDLVRQPDAQRLVRTHLASGETQFLGATRADRPGEPLRAPAARDDPEQDLGLAEHRLGGGDAVVACQGELSPAAERIPAHRSDHEPRDRSNRVERIVERCTDRGCLVGPGELGDVGAAHEPAVAAGDHHAHPAARR